MICRGITCRIVLIAWLLVTASTTAPTTTTKKEKTVLSNLYERIITWRHTRRKHKHMKYKNLEPSDD